MKPSDFVPPTLTSAVNTYLLSRAYAEIIRERIDSIYANLLEEYPIFEGMEYNGRTLGSGVRVVARENMFLSQDSETLCKIYSEVNKRARAAGLKPASMSDDCCPALVAEELQRQAERAIVDIAIDAHELHCAGPRKWGAYFDEEFIDLTIKLVVNSPGYKAPRIAA